MGEDKLIERFRRVARPGRAARRDLLLGIGDDAAVLRWPARRELVLTCDALFENVHFLAHVHPPEAVGYKALARAVSDITAMGARPRFFLLSLALPSSRTGSWLDKFLRGLDRAARECRATLAGGDTLQYASVAVNVTVLGEVAPGRAVTRAGARPGDVLCVSSTAGSGLGAAQLGLELILRGLYRERAWKALLRPHLRPPLRVALGQYLAQKAGVSAMMDLSDGLSTDLHRLCRASGAGARIYAGRLPQVRLPQGLRGHGFDPLLLALHGGEDYELLFTLPRRRAQRLPKSWRGVKLTPIGEITAGKDVTLLHPDGRSEPLTPRGWDHFRSR